MAPKQRSSAGAKTIEYLNEVPWRSQFITANTRPYMTKEGHFMRNGVEQKSFEDLTATFTAATAESRNRPMVSFSTFSGTLSQGLHVIKEGQQMKLLGDGVKYLIQEVDAVMPSLVLCNSFGATDALRTETSLHAAVKDIIAFLRKVSKTPNFLLFLQKMLHSGQAMTHMSYQLMEWVSAVQDMPAYLGAIGRVAQQPCSSALQEAIDAQGRKRSRELFESYMAKALNERSGNKATAPSAAGSSTDFTSLGSSMD